MALEGSIIQSQQLSFEYLETTAVTCSLLLPEEIKVVKFAFLV
jgi:hypothetical protein